MNQQRVVLIAEDDPDDVFMMERSAQRMKGAILLRFVKNGSDAIDYQSGVNQYADRALFPLPSLILLDIKMPLIGGFEVLEWLNGNKAFHSIPVAMLSSSTLPSDAVKARELGAKAYLVKPVKPEKLKQLFTDTEAFLASQSD